MADWLSMFDSQLEVAPPLGDAQLLSIPAKRGVLALLAENDAPILLLTAADIRARLRTRLAEVDPALRKKTADLRGITRKITWKLCGGHFEADLAYFELAGAIWPDTCAQLLSWKPAWFVHVDAAEEFPHFSRTREVFQRQGVYVGPFEGGRSADKFIESIQDAMDLCRDLNCLRQAPHAPPCAYLQMGRCLGPCNGTISMQEYRQAVGRAAQFAAGDRQPVLDDFQRRMKEAAAALQFEKAATLKARLARLKDFDKEEYRHVAPAEEFVYIVVGQMKIHQAGSFLVNCGTVKAGPSLDYPPRTQQLEALLHDPLLTQGQSPAGTVQARALGQTDRLRMGLVAHYLFSGEQRRGLILKWHTNLTAAEMAAAIEASADALGLKKPPEKKQKAEGT